MLNTKHKPGRLGNQIIRNFIVSEIAEKFNLKADYGCSEISELGLEFYKDGERKKGKHENLKDDNILMYLFHKDKLDKDFLVLSGPCWFQQKEIGEYMYKRFNEDEIKNKIIEKNPFRHRMGNNNNIFIHIRLGDVVKHNPGYDYYKKCIDMIKEYDRIYIGSDSPGHLMIKRLLNEFPNSEVYNNSPILTIQFASTCKNIILSHGSFSFIIGILAYEKENVYYPYFTQRQLEWCRDIFGKDWIEVK